MLGRRMDVRDDRLDGWIAVAWDAASLSNPYIPASCGIKRLRGLKKVFGE